MSPGRQSRSDSRPRRTDELKTFISGSVPSWLRGQSRVPRRNQARVRATPSDVPTLVVAERLTYTIGYTKEQTLTLVRFAWPLLDVKADKHIGLQGPRRIESVVGFLPPLGQASEDRTIGVRNGYRYLERAELRAGARI